MLLNKQAVKQVVAENGKQCSKEFVEKLDRKVTVIIMAAAQKCPGKRLLAEDLA